MINHEEQAVKQMHVHKRRVTGCQRTQARPQVQAEKGALDGILQRLYRTAPIHVLK